MFMEYHASNYVERDNTIKKIFERFFWPEYCKDTISMIMSLEYFYFSLIYTFVLKFSKFTLEQRTDYIGEVFSTY